MANYKYKVNMNGVAAIHKQLTTAVEQTAEATVGDLKASQTLPYNVGTLDLSTTWSRDSAKVGVVSISSNTPYARRLYFHPEYNFRKTNNRNAGARWFDPYINGDKKEFVKKTFLKFAKK